MIPRIPYFKTSRYRVETMIQLAQIKPGELVADLGSGDGRIAIAAALAGAQVVGFELDEQLIQKSEQEIKNQNLEDTIVILKQDFWEQDLSKFDVVVMYPMPDIMLQLERKLKSELKPNSRILLNYYTFPNWHYTKSKNKTYLYKL